MNEHHRKALRENSSKLLDLDLTPELTAKLLQYGIFNEDMVEEIKSGHTTKERVQKMLLKLPRRGPRAYDKFCKAIQDTYPWLADDLRKSAEIYSHKSESETLTLKKMVDIHVDQKFGSSKRLSEEDKKEIRKFIYKELKNGLDGHIENHNQEMEVQNVLQRVYKKMTECSTCSTSDNEDDESVTGVDGEVTLEMINSKIDDRKKEIDDLKNINKTCLKMLEFEDSGFPLDDILSTYIDNRNDEKKQLTILSKKVDILEKKRRQLETLLSEKMEEFNAMRVDLEASRLQTEKVKQKKCELKSKCEQLEKMQQEHFKKQNTLTDMKDLLTRFQSNLSRPKQEPPRLSYPLDSVDGPTQTEISLPSIRQSQKSSRSHRSRQSTEPARSYVRNIPHANHRHELPGRERPYEKWNY